MSSEPFMKSIKSWGQVLMNIATKKGCNCSWKRQVSLSKGS